VIAAAVGSKTRLYNVPISCLESADEGSSKVVPTHNMKAYGGCRGKLHSYLTLTLNGGKWSI
jgi:hypothetical protein